MKRSWIPLTLVLIHAAFGRALLGVSIAFES